jgi:hypothetical protein
VPQRTQNEMLGTTSTETLDEDENIVHGVA